MRLGECTLEINALEFGGKGVHNGLSELIEMTLVGEDGVQVRPAPSGRRCVCATQAGRSRGSKVHCAPGPTTAEQKPIEEMCPSPMPRRLSATRAWPVRRPPWSGPSTALGLHRAAPSVAYSAVKARAEEQRARSRQLARLRHVRGHDRRVPPQERLIVCDGDRRSPGAGPQPAARPRPPAGLMTRSMTWPAREWPGAAPRQAGKGAR